jgi:hypothetical protein
MLTQQYFRDQWLKIEEQRLNYIRFNQRQLRADLYCGFADAVASDDTRNAGRYVVLPSTHLGSPRNMFGNFADAMGIMAMYGKPDYFFTVTANPKWPEIIAACPPNCTPTLSRECSRRNSTV